MMTPEQAGNLQIFAMAAGGVGVAETLMGIALARASGPQKALSRFFLYAGPGFLFAAAVLYFAWDYRQTMIAAVVVAVIGCSLGAMKLLEATKASSGDQPR
jgi:hypothetical protein